MNMKKVISMMVTLGISQGYTMEESSLIDTSSTPAAQQIGSKFNLDRINHKHVIAEIMLDYVGLSKGATILHRSNRSARKLINENLINKVAPAAQQVGSVNKSEYDFKGITSKGVIANIMLGYVGVNEGARILDGLNSNMHKLIRNNEDLMHTTFQDQQDQAEAAPAKHKELIKEYKERIKKLISEDPSSTLIQELEEKLKKERELKARALKNIDLAYQSRIVEKNRNKLRMIRIKREEFDAASMVYDEKRKKLKELMGSRGLATQIERGKSYSPITDLDMTTAMQEEEDARSLYDKHKNGLIHISRLVVDQLKKEEAQEGEDVWEEYCRPIALRMDHHRKVLDETEEENRRIENALKEKLKEQFKSAPPTEELLATAEKMSRIDRIMSEAKGIYRKKLNEAGRAQGRGIEKQRKGQELFQRMIAKASILPG